MSQDLHQHITNKTNKARIRYLDLSNNNFTGSADLSQFTSPKVLNAYNNQLESMEFLNTLPNKEQLTSLNFFGNQVKEIDLAWLLKEFPNLEKINLGNNPIKTKNLTNLTSEQFNSLINKMKENKIKLNSYKGTVLMELLTYAQELVNTGNTQHAQNANYLQSLVQQSNSSSQLANNQPPYLLIGGLTLFGVSALAFGYLWGKKNQESELEN